MNFHKKKLFLSILLVVGIAVAFWLGSRYPQLNSKALMGVDSPSMGISFDVVKEVNESDSDFTKIVSNTINWMDTNKKGMTFGFLFGAAFILLFSLLKDVKIKNRFLNTAIGAIIGAPLGVCVNCAAPIAKGMKDAGARTETAIATMISSPTLNVIVLTMLFSFLPIYMVWLKIGFTLLFIFTVIPLLSYLVSDKQTALETPEPIKVPVFNLEVEYTDKFTPSTWLKAGSWTAQFYLKSLWFIVKTTLPLMILAGLLGNIIITYFPLEGLIDLVKNLSVPEKVVYMGLIALFATFLPVPIAFDVIITAILWSTGLHTRFAMVLLFCLGTFSIYSSFIVAKSFSIKLAVYLFLATAIFGFSAGIISHFMEKEMGLNYRLENYEKLKNSGAVPNYIHGQIKLDDDLSFQNIQLLLNKKQVGEKVYSQDSIEIVRSEFTPHEKSKSSEFESIEGLELGLVVPYQFSSKEIHDPFANQRSIASGDIHKDGFADLLVVSADDVFLYANINGKEFKRQQLTSMKEKSVFNAALVDFDNDGWLDIFISTYRNGNYIIANDSGNFDDNIPVKLPQLDDLILTTAPAFADIDKDGKIDIVLGNWSIGALGAADFAMKEARNFWLKNLGDFNFELKTLEGVDGETLSVLLADINDDGQSDMIVGNDFNAPDNYYLSQASKNDFSLVKNPESIVERSTYTTMSIVATDVNNDLISEVFQVQVDRLNGNIKTDNISKICGGIQNDLERATCEKIFSLQQDFLQASATKNFDNCPEDFKNDCIAAELVRANVSQEKIEESCNYFSDEWETFKFICELRLKDNKRYPRVKEGSYEEKTQGGIFLMKDTTEQFKDVTEIYQLKQTGWSWNSKFADVDNDEWQDLFIANGYLFQLSQESNLFYKNIEGKTFENQTEKANLTNYLPASSYTYVDYDLDGDLDIILAPSLGPLYVYKNNYHQNNSIAFKVNDSKGNRSAVGAIITIFYGDGKHQKREIALSGGYKSFDETKVYFGLGEHIKIDKVEIDWATGSKTVIDASLVAGSLYQIERK